jgi:activator of HSP90 ATPase
MNIQRDETLSAALLSRRQALAGFVIAIGSVAMAPWALGDAPKAMVEEPVNKENQTRTSIHQEVPLKASPGQIYAALLDSAQFTAFSGLPAEIDSKEGGAFSTFGGVISGRNVELVPDVRIVQAWRPASWDEGIYSIVEFELEPQGSGTLIVFDHKGFPEGKYDGLLSGWTEHYWVPLAKYLA